MKQSARKCWGLSHLSLLELTQLSMLAAIAVVLVMLIHFPVIPSVPFIEYDMADVPVLLAAFLYGPVPGLAVLLVVSFVQAILLGGNGWVGLIMHFVASGVMILSASLIYRSKPSRHRLIIGLIVGAVSMTVTMIPMNLIFTVHFFGIPHDTVMALMLPGIVPMNLLKASVNCAISGILFTVLQPVFRKFSVENSDKTA